MYQETSQELVRNTILGFKQNISKKKTAYLKRCFSLFFDHEEDKDRLIEYILYVNLMHYFGHDHEIPEFHMFRGHDDLHDLMEREKDYLSNLNNLNNVNIHLIGIFL